MTEPLFLLDSNTCIYILGGLSASLRAQVEARAPGTVVTSAIVCAEVLRGIDPADIATNRKLPRLFEAIPVLPFDEAAARASATVPFKRGKFDRLIAAHALALGLTLITDNEADFADVPGLKIENWTLPL